ncbi:hypothetical protein F8568_031765 [Actinomadura sp. LD22]|uniref:EthD family reductase n=1 Tax=Actinomadura physcomitrii TaxID=2650748 RepID=A0A6I4MLL8_9ACTN|nr:DUF4286 family protein [Actinomadura physcomitrii]MWA04867.1 hypothetical protein [Actinomadura physcomitrii]
MSKKILTVFTEPVSPEREAEFDKWYSETHVPDVTAIPGVLSVRRFKLPDAEATGAGLADGRRYLAIYELDVDDTRKLDEEMTARITDGRFSMSDALTMDPAPVTVYWDEIPLP